MKRHIIITILTIVLSFVSSIADAQIDKGSIEAMIANHKDVAVALEIRTGAELGVSKMHKKSAKKVAEYRATSDSLDRYKRCFQMVDLLLKTGATAFHTVRTYRSVSGNLKGYWNLLKTYNDKILSNGDVWKSDIMIYETSKKAVNDVADEADELYKSYLDFTLLIGGKNSPKETRIVDMMESIDKINASMDRIDNIIGNAYLELWSYMTCRLGYWKKDLFRMKTMKEMADGAYSNWVKAQMKAYSCLQQKKSYKLSSTLGGGGLIGERRRKKIFMPGDINNKYQGEVDKNFGDLIDNKKNQ